MWATVFCFVFLFVVYAVAREELESIREKVALFFFFLEGKGELKG